MSKKIVATPGAPKAIGPYSQAIWTGDLLYCSGQIPLDPVTGNVVPGGIVEQTQRVLENVQALLQSQELSFEHVVKTTVFLVDMAHFTAMNEVYGKYFTNDFPARSTVQVARLPKDVLVEIEVLASR